MKVLEKRICRAKDCKKPLKSRGLCDMHYARLRRYGTLERKTIDYTDFDICVAIGCDEAPESSGLCGKHYAMLRRKGSPYSPKIIRLCAIENCYGDHLAKGLCKNHYNEWRKIIEEKELENHLVGKKLNE